MTEIPQAHLETMCLKNPRCRFLGSRDNKKICLKNSPFAAAVIQLEKAYSKEAEIDQDKDCPKGDNCVGLDYLPIKLE